jgi:ligand-binding sensor domain-containing protein
LTADFLLNNFKYFVKGAMKPFEAINVSSDFYNISDLVVNDIIISDNGDAWMATNQGLLYLYTNDNIAIIPISSMSSIGITALCFDKNNRIYCSTVSALYYSDDHANFVLLSVSGANLIGITSLTAYGDSLVVGTEENGCYIINTLYNTLIKIQSNGITQGDNIVSSNGLQSNFVTCVAVDDNDIVWIGTISGLYRYYNGLLLSFTNKNGLANNRVNDICIRNSAIRYIATSNGINKMTGTSFTYISAANNNIWNNNVKSIAWQEPDIIWAGSLSKINKIVEITDKEYLTTVYNLEDYTFITAVPDNYQLYYILTDQEIIDTDVVEVYINNCLIFEG